MEDAAEKWLRSGSARPLCGGCAMLRRPLAAAARRRMFQSFLGGERIARIARTRRAEKIPIPSGHWKRIGAPNWAAKRAAPYVWPSIHRLSLQAPGIYGAQVLRENVCENYKAQSARAGLSKIQNIRSRCAGQLEQKQTRTKRHEQER